MDWLNYVKNRSQQAWVFLRFVWLNFINDDCFYRASALAFTSLLAVVPLMTVGLAILSAFPVFQQLVQPLQDFIFQNFVPATGKIIQNYVQLFTAQVSRLPLWGVAFLLLSALLVMLTIEQAMNKIWRVTTPRKGVTAFLLYWSILSLAPVFLGLSLAASSYLISIPFIRDNYTPSLLLTTVPYLLSLSGFTFLYVVVPNYPVKLSHGFWGAVVATLLFESAKLAFAFYLKRYNTYELLYGAFATVPLFFIWVYWVWVITLLGAEISYALSVHYQRRSGKPLQGFLHALLWLRHLWLAQQHSKGCSLESLIASNSQPYAVDVKDMLQLLTQQGLIHVTANDDYWLSADLNRINLYQLAGKLPYRLPQREEVMHLKIKDAPQWQQLFIRSDEELSKLLNVPLNELFH